MATPVENPPRLYYNGLRNTVPGAINSGDLTITFASTLTHVGGNVPSLVGGNGHIPLHILDPTTGILRETVWITAYTSGGTVATVTRLQQGTGGGTHPAGCQVVCGISDYDFGTVSTWAPVAWTGATTDPVLGNGSTQGTYSLHGPMCAFGIVILAGSSTTYGSGQWFVELPVPVTGEMRAWGSIRYGGNPYMIGGADTAVGGRTTGLRVTAPTAGNPSVNVSSAAPETASSANLPTIRLTGTYLWC